MNFLKAVMGGRKDQRELVDSAHASIMAQALQPAFFGDGRVEDTFAGRFEVAALHSALALRRLRELGPTGQAFAQEVFDELFSGFDDALREIGTGDLRVGKKIRRIGEAFYGRARAYDAALAPDAAETALADAIARNIDLEDQVASSFAQYARKVAAALDAQGEESLLSAQFDWPDATLSL